SPDASASAQEQTKARGPMPPSSVSSKHADDENSTHGRSSPKPSQTPERVFRLQCCLLLCYQPDKGKVNDYSAISSLYFLGMAPSLSTAASNASNPRMASGAAASIQASFLMLFMSYIGGCSPWMALFLGEVGCLRKGAPRRKGRPLRKPQARVLAAVALLIANSLPVAFLPNGERRQGTVLLAVTKPPGTLR